MSKTIVIVSDIQVGHKLSIAPEGAPISQNPPAEPTVLRLNKVQKGLLECWKETVRDWKRPDYLVINGEPIEGQQSHNRGAEVYTTDMNDQLEGAKMLIDMFKADKIYATRGTDYHTTLNGIQFEEAFGKMVGGQTYGGYYAPPQLFLEVERVMFDIAHHVGRTMVWHYRSTPMSREMLLAKVNASHKWPSAVTIRSHNHYYWDVGTTSHRGIATPCWQLATWYAYRHTAWLVPDIGAIRIKVEDGEFTWEKKIFNDRNVFKPPVIVDGIEHTPEEYQKLLRKREFVKK